MPEINPRSPIPKHHQLREVLLELMDGELCVDSPIPSERELAERYGLSRMTVRQGINSLVAEGRLTRVAGVGTFVAAPKLDVQARLASFTEDMLSRGMRPGMTLLALEKIEAGTHVAKQLDVPRGEPVIRIDRLRYADGVPMSVQNTYLPEALVPGLLEQPFEGSLHQLLRERYSLTVDWGEQTIEAATADPELARLLEISNGTPILRLHRRSYAGDRLVEYDVSSYRADRYQLWVPLSRPVAPFRTARTAHNQGGSS